MLRPVLLLLGVALLLVACGDDDEPSTEAAPTDAASTTLRWTVELHQEQGSDIPLEAVSTWSLAVALENGGATATYLLEGEPDWSGQLGADAAVAVQQLAAEAALGPNVTPPDGGSLVVASIDRGDGQAVTGSPLQPNDWLAVACSVDELARAESGRTEIGPACPVGYEPIRP